jgi:non-ribosomal peptide synthetase component F
VEFHRASLPFQLGQANLLENSTAGDTASFRKDFDLEQYKVLAEYCEAMNLREHELIFGLLCVAVSEVFDRPDVLMGVRVTGRYLPGVANLVGSFVSTLPLNINVPRVDIRSICTSVASQFREFHSHQEVSLAKIIEGSIWQDISSLDELLQVSFSYQDVRKRAGSFADLTLSQSLVPRHQTELPLEAWIRMEESGFSLFFDYDSGRVSRGVVERLGAGFESALQRLNVTEPILVEKAVKKPIWRRLFN